MTSTRLHVHKLFDGLETHDHLVLTIEHGKVQSIDNDIDRVDQVVEGFVVPGFIDLQVNGGGGVLFNDSPSLSSFKNHHRRTFSIWHNRYAANIDHG